MLLRYNVSNFKSIGEKIEYSMFPFNNENPEYLSHIETVTGTWKVLKRGALFGPNASGKTSFIDSINFSRKYILKGSTSTKLTRVNQFKGTEDDITVFDYVIYAGGDVFQYGFALDKYCIHEEWLYKLNKDGNMKPLFTRFLNEKNITDIEITSAYSRNNSMNRKIAELSKEMVKPNQLFLTKLYDNKSHATAIDNVMKWFENLQIIYPFTHVHALPLYVKEDDTFSAFLSKNLENMDTGIHNISVATEEYSLEKFQDRFNLPDEFIQEIEEKQTGVISLNGQYFIFSDTKKNHSIKFVGLKFEHRLKENSVSLNIEEESDGTQRIINLFPILFEIDKSNTNKIYIVDELDRSLHTKLSRNFIRMFEQATADVQAQLIFTAHDVNLLDLDLFRSEEIWFIEKKYTGETKIRPFSDFDIKDNGNILNDYLNGRFGAIPIIRGDQEYDND